MVLRIIRGALLGIVLGLLMGIGLSGSMYMFNYMKSGGDWENEKRLVAQEEKGTFTVDASRNDMIPAISISSVAKRDYDAKELEVTLKEQGISSLARIIAQDNWLGDSETEIGTTQSDSDVLGDNLIRFHVRANSNSDVDIALKYKVRDRVLDAIDQELSKCTTKEAAKGYLAENLELIKEVAENTLSGEGYNYSVNAYLTNDYFPIRQYGDMVLPAGYYEALRIDIGLANGENFWCLLYPTMCVPVEAGGVLTKEGQEEIEKDLTPEQYDKLFVKKEVTKENIEVRFKLFDFLFGEK